MAEFAIAYVVEKLANLVVDYAEELGEIKKSVMELKENLDSIQKYLEIAFSTKKAADAEIEGWVEKIRDLGYDVEDLLDELVAEMELQRASFWKSKIRRAVIYKHLPRLAPSPLRSLQRITKLVKELNLEMRNFFDFEVVAAAASYDDRSRWGRGCAGDMSVPVLVEGGENDVFGFEAYATKIVEHLIQAGDDISFVAVVGMGGCGKTTLARLVYNRIQKEFDCCVWLTASASGYQGKDVLIDILQQSYGSRVLVSGAGSGEEEEESFDDRLGKTISTFLQGKSFLMVLDDVWDLGVWENVERVLPHRSRIILTTRLGSFAQTIPGCKYVLRLPGLSMEDAWSLFCKKAFAPLLPPPAEGEEDTDYAHLKSIGKKIVMKCYGLPLAIITIGGLLSTKTEPREWEGVLKLFDLHLTSGTLDMNGIADAVVSMAYADLPHWLKPCFLYCGLFPENYEFPVKKLCRMWLAEGFTQKFSQGKMVEEEENGKYALYQLLRRNLIQIARVGTNGEIETYRILQPMRSFVIRTSSRYNFYTIHSKVSAIPRNSRRLSLAWPSMTDVASNTSMLRLEKTRALVLLGKINCQQQVPSPMSMLKTLRVIRVLDLNHVTVKTLPSNFNCLVHLRYLGLRGTGVKNLTSSLGRLSNLQTLDLRDTRVMDLDIGCKLFNLRHLLLSSSYMDKVVQLPDGIEFSSLANLQTLSGVKFTAKVAQGLETLTQLRKLSGGQLREEVSVRLCSSLNRLTSLSSLVVKCDHQERFNLETLGNPATISKLRLGGQMEKFDRVANISSLTYLYLWDTLLEQDPLQALGNLPNLVHLSLCNAFKGHTMRCNPGGFPELKKLSVVRFRHLEKWEKLEGGAMHSLRELFISHCPKLRKLPEGLVDLDSLQVLKVLDMPFVLEEKPRFKVIYIPQILTTPKK